MSPGGRTHAGVEAGGCGSRWIESGCATMLRPCVALSMSRYDSIGHGVGIGGNGSSGISSSVMSRHDEVWTHWDSFSFYAESTDAGVDSLESKAAGQQCET